MNINIYKRGSCAPVMKAGGGPKGPAAPIWVSEGPTPPTAGSFMNLAEASCLFVCFFSLCGGDTRMVFSINRGATAAPHSVPVCRLKN